MSRTGFALAGWLVLACAGCHLSVSEGPAAVQPRPGPTDLTFFVGADLHLGYTGTEEVNRALIAAMNTLPGTLCPGGAEGVVGKPRGVLIAGDLTDKGRNDATAPSWDLFVKLYGLNGNDALLKYPIYECTGNHDRDAPLWYLYKPVVEAVRARHGSLTYSWDWGDVHVVCLDLYPDLFNRLWLRKDLSAVGRERPVVIYFHYPILGPFSEWWSQADKEAFRKVIDAYNVVGIFHGHYHGSEHYVWQGYDVYNVGSCRHHPHSFAVVHMTDETMTVASWNWDYGGWQWRHSKRINTRSRKTEQ